MAAYCNWWNKNISDLHEHEADFCKKYDQDCDRCPAKVFEKYTDEELFKLMSGSEIEGDKR